MDFDTNNKKDSTFQTLPLLNNNNHLKLEKITEEDNYFSFDKFSSSSTSSSKALFQDLHQLDLHPLDSSSSFLNPQFGVPSGFFDPYDPSSNISFPNLSDLYGCKPFLDHKTKNNNANFVALQNFESGRGSDIFNFNDENLGSGSSLFKLKEIKPVNTFIPDESSCITSENSSFRKISFKGKVVQQRRKQCESDMKKPNAIKGQWTTEEDRILIDLVRKNGIRKWSHIAQRLKGRIGKQCRERWHNHLRPNIKKDIWTEEEDTLLIQAHNEVGNKWAEIAKRLPGRTENSIKNHWNATKRRQYSKRKCRTKHPITSNILQNYIKSLNLDGKPNNNTNTLPFPFTSPQIYNTPSSLSHGNLLNNGSDDHLLKEFEINDIPDFSFDENLFGEESSIDSILDDLDNIPIVEEEKNGFEIGSGFVESLFMQVEVKKEMDLIEMITQANI